MDRVENVDSLEILIDSIKYNKLLKGIFYTRVFLSIMFLSLLFGLRLEIVQLFFGSLNLFLVSLLLLVILIRLDMRNSNVIESIFLSEHEVTICYTSFFFISKRLSCKHRELQLVAKFEKNVFRRKQSIDHFLIVMISGHSKIKFRMQRDDIVDVLIRYHDFYKISIPIEVQYSLNEIKRLKSEKL